MIDETYIRHLVA